MGFCHFPSAAALVAASILVSTAAQGFGAIGNTYVQGHDSNLAAGRGYAAIGVASYHFDSSDEVYIHYCVHTMPNWRFDGGAALPERKDFTQKSFNASTRIFTGTIDWMLPGITGVAPGTMGGRAQWRYTMVFNADYTQIRGGRILEFSSDHTVMSVTNFGAWHYTVLNSGSECGDQSIEDPGLFGAINRTYVRGNGDVLSDYAEVGSQSIHFENAASPFLHNCALSAEFQQEGPINLDNGEPAPEILNFTFPVYDRHNRVFHGGVNFLELLGSTVNSAASWEYTLGFSADYATIVSGHITPYDRYGDALAVIRFEDGGIHYAALADNAEESPCMRSMSPTAVPSSTPTAEPTAQPSTRPSPTPTALPTAIPTARPSTAPVTSSPTALPTRMPTSSSPTRRPTRTPTPMPSDRPTDRPTSWPTQAPTATPTTGGDTDANRADGSSGNDDAADTGSNIVIIAVIVAMLLLLAVVGVGVVWYINRAPATGRDGPVGFDNPLYADAGAPPATGQTRSGGAASNPLYAEADAGSASSGYMDIPAGAPAGYMDVAPAFGAAHDDLEEDV